MTAAIVIALLFALPPAVLYAFNVRLFRPPPKADGPPAAISVLIPARNEERAIRACVEAVLASVQVDLECIVLDDHSTDRTAAIVRELAATDPRLRLEVAPPLPEGWAGKQHACFVLAGLATKPLLSFLDADVRLAPDALARLAAFQRASTAALVSGFPRQETITLLEKLLIPLIHFILLGFLPIARMRRKCDPSLGAGCGQWFLTPRDSYNRIGGHAAVKASFHDGVKLPRAYRAAGMMTDICDATPLATCRMYRRAGEVWNGLAKNAREGLGSPVGLGFWTIALTLGQILPFGLAALGELAGIALSVVLLAVRLHSASRFRQSYLGALLHPLAIALLLAIQWYAAVRAWLGRPVGWKGRARSPAGEL